MLPMRHEAANEMFREDVGLGFLDIPTLIDGAMEAIKDDFKDKDVTLDDILGCHAWARKYVAENAQNVIKKSSSLLL